MNGRDSANWWQTAYWLSLQAVTMAGIQILYDTCQESVVCASATFSCSATYISSALVKSLGFEIKKISTFQFIPGK